MLKSGDAILIAVVGPYGAGLVQATVWMAAVRVDPRLTAHGHLRVFEAHDEGRTWTRGHDPTTPEAAALLVAAALS